MTITEVVDSLAPEDVQAKGSVIRLREAAPGSNGVRQHVGGCLLALGVERNLPPHLDAIIKESDHVAAP